MNITTKLQMVFYTDGDRNHTVTINEPKENLVDADVKLLMDTIISNAALESNYGKITAIKSAAIITRTVVPFVVL